MDGLRSPGDPDKGAAVDRDSVRVECLELHKTGALEEVDGHRGARPHQFDLGAVLDMVTHMSPDVLDARGRVRHRDGIRPEPGLELESVGFQRVRDASRGFESEVQAIVTQSAGAEEEAMESHPKH